MPLCIVAILVFHMVLVSREYFRISRPTVSLTKIFAGSATGVFQISQAAWLMEAAKKPSGAYSQTQIILAMSSCPTEHLRSKENKPSRTPNMVPRRKCYNFC
jgi:hypothetical protein